MYKPPGCLEVDHARDNDVVVVDSWSIGGDDIGCTWKPGISEAFCALLCTSFEAQEGRR